MSQMRTALCTSALLLSVFAFPATAAVSTHHATRSGQPHGLVSPPASVTRGACTIAREKVVSTAQGASTSSTTPVNLPNAVIDLSLATTGCVIVDLSAETFAPNGELMQVQVLLDGAQMAPGLTQLSGNDVQWATSHAHSFVATNVPSGTHVIQVQYNSLEGNPVYVNDFTLTARFH